MPEQESVRNKILCVDDDEKSRILLRKILETDGFLVKEAVNGEEALEKLTQVHPDLIIMGLQMPVLDGFQTMRRIRELPEFDQVPAIALTARGVDDDRDTIIRAGYSGFLCKPIQRLLLVEEVERLLFPADPYAHQLEGKQNITRVDELAGKKLLLVDDNAIHLQMGEKIFTQAGMEIIKAVDGEDALNHLKTSSDIDIILADILMPGMDGYQLCRMVKTTGSLMEIPFVFYTSTYADNKDIRFGLDLGADRYIIRPIPAKRLLEIVKEVLLEKNQKGTSPPAVPDDAFMVDEVKYYREYNQRLISKLEQKLLEIDNAYRALEMRNVELKNFSQTLEKKISERTRELEEANNNLRELDRKKTEFLNIVAHDLRTPMTTIRSYSELLLKYKDEPQETRDEFLQIIIQESIRLGNLVNDYLDLTKIESGLDRFNNEPVDLTSRIKHVVNLFRARSDAKGVIIEMQLAPEQLTVQGDQDKLDQVMMNLLSNAVKFCQPGGKIEVCSWLIRPGEQAGLPYSRVLSVDEDSIGIMVRDTGPGIPEDFKEKIFDKFYQLETPLVKSSGGTGLGLSIVKWIVDQHQGRIWVEGREGEGSAFFLVLPLMIK